MSIWDKLVGGKPKQTADSPELIRKNISDGTAVMLDVRSQGERDDGYLKDSIFIPITEIKELSPDVKTIENLPKEQVIYCH